MIESKANQAEESKHKELFVEAKENPIGREVDFSSQIVRNLKEGKHLGAEVVQQRKLVRHKSATVIEPRLNMPISPGRSSKVVKAQSKMLESIIRGQSKMEYIPFEKKVIQYKNEQKITRVPKKRFVTEYREQKTIQTVPREVIKQDYYAVQHLRKYIPQEIEMREKVLVPKQVVRKKIQYVPVQKQIIRKPPEAHCQGYPAFYHQPMQVMEPGIIHEGILPGHSNMSRFGNTSSLIRKQHLSGSHETLTSRKSPQSKKLRFSTLNHTDLYESYISDTHV